MKQTQQNNKELVLSIDFIKSLNTIGELQKRIKEINKLNSEFN